jgi:signal transduction histidine kinase
MIAARARLIAAVLLTVSLVAAAAQPDQPKRVLILNSSTFNTIADVLRAELNRQLPGRLDLYEEWLVSARFTAEANDEAFANYLSDLFANRPLDLIIALGGPATNFVHKYEHRVFHSTPVLFAEVEARKLPAVAFAPNETGLAFSRDFSTLIGSILRILPQTTTLVVVTGNTPLDRQWADEFRAGAQPFKDRLSLIVLSDLSFDEVLKRVARLPPGSAIYPELINPSIEGIPPDNDTALAKLHAAADAPMFQHWDYALGKGIVGGPMISHEAYGRAAAGLAARLLQGESPSSIRVSPIPLANPRYDWRELRRWHIRESDLPPGSQISFRELGAWDRYRWQILSAAALMLIEAALILALLYEHRRRQQAEIEAHGRLSELAHMNRRSTVGELSASVAHELQQPLTAILSNTEAAELILSRVPGAVAGEVKDILADIKRDDLRASEVIKRLRRLLAKASPEPQEVNLNEVISEVFELLSAQAAARHVSLTTNLALRPPRVSGDRIQLQQVVLNLVMNALDSIAGANSAERRIVGRTCIVDDTSAEVSIADSGPGVATDKVEQIFEPFFTTKDSGMGMGLSIARTIVESHGGRISAQNQRGGGAVFVFSLPLAREATNVAHEVAGFAKPAPSADNL